VLIFWLLAIPTYPQELIFFLYSFLIFFAFSLMGAFGIVYRGKIDFEPAGEGSRLGNLLSASTVRFSGVRVGLSFLVAVNTHRIFSLHDFDKSYMFALMFLIFFFLAGPFPSKSRGD
jgi:hypothetical protein